jgi:hypothetical protein
MKNSNILYFVLLLYSLGSGCSVETDKKVNNDFANQPTITGPGEEITVPRITHGDTPMWLLLMKQHEEWDESKDKELIALLNSYDTLYYDQIKYKDKVVWNLKSSEIKEILKADNKENLPNDQTKWKGNDAVLWFRGDSLSTISISSFDKLFLKGKMLSQYQIRDFKELFPHSYSIRNYYGDDYYFNFTHEVPDSYDHLIIAADSSGKYFHIRFINGYVVDFEFNGYKGY